MSWQLTADHSMQPVTIRLTVDSHSLTWDVTLLYKQCSSLEMLNSTFSIINDRSVIIK